MHKKNNCKIYKGDNYYVDLPQFRHFVNKAFDEMVSHATVEDLANFAFGNMEEAISSFRNLSKYEVAK